MAPVDWSNTDRSTPARAWQIILARAVDAGIAPVVAVLFWAVMIVLVLLATAQSKDRPWADFFAAFGSVGQVFFAGAIYLISRRQFEFTKLVANRQARIEVYEHRSKLFQRFLELRRSFTNKNFTEAVPFDFSAYARNVRQVFSSTTSALADALTAHLFDLAEINDKMLEEQERPEPSRARLTELRKERTAINKLVRESASRLFTAMSKDTELNID